MNAGSQGGVLFSFYMLVAFLDSQALYSLLTQQQEGGAHLLKHVLRYFVFKGQGLVLCFALDFLNSLNKAAWEKSLPY